jgi:ABC-2 type transport system ATP-binding protein
VSPNDHVELTDLTNKIDAQVGTLSRGMKHAAVAGSSVPARPGLLLIDETPSGLEPRARIEVRELLKGFTLVGKTIPISSHILHEPAHLCARIGIVKAGEMAAQGAFNAICSQLLLFRIVHLQLANPTPELLE